MSRRTFYTTVVIMLLAFGLSALTLITSTGGRSEIGTAAVASEPTSTTEPLVTTTSSTAAPSTSTTTTSTTVATTTTSVVRTTTTMAPATTVTTARPATTVTTAPPAATSAAQPTCSHIDIDISAQRLTARCTDGNWAVPISSGHGQYYSESGGEGWAITPRGSFSVYRMYNGTEEAPLGDLYKPMYFYKGYAIHGGALPGYPASHGCVRVSYLDADWLFKAVYIGTTVVVHD